MRNATIFVANLKGVATETIKNIVLAGIGKLIVWDSGSVQGEDLGTGFFFTDEDVGELVFIATSYMTLFLAHHELACRCRSSKNRGS